MPSAAKGGIRSDIFNQDRSAAMNTQPITAARRGVSPHKNVCAIINFVGRSHSFKSAEAVR